MVNRCSSCNVDVSEDLKYCPLCGKFVLDNENAQPKETINSYPIYNMFYIYRAKWLKMVKEVLFVLAILCIAINIMFYSGVVWSFYTTLGLYLLWKIVFMPFSEGTNHLKRLPHSSLIIALSIVLLDLFTHIQFGVKIGWGIVFASPSVLTLGLVITFILSFAVKGYDLNYTKANIFMILLSIIFFIVRLFVLIDFALWPTFMLLITSILNLIILLIFKKKRIINEINRSFHI